ncbi:MAG TPA: amidohydrolase family protein [Nocardioidaceae bacterium]|nr:amidohydrolase family protein [Nocardioidaceae bacterium]
MAFGGSVIRAGGTVADGWVVVSEGRVVDIRSTKPSDVVSIATDGVVLPGLIDLHGHPEYNVFSPWEPPKTFINRGQWRNSDEYDALVKTPWSLLTSAGTSRSVKTAMTRYAEVRAAVGGVTAIQGASQDYPNKAEALVRNVDLVVFGEQIARSTIDFGRLAPDRIESIRKGIFDNHTIKAHYVHLAEGQKSNTTSVNEFMDFAASPLFGPATVVIHGTALTRTHFEQIAAVGGKLVWSPQSNLRLYDETTDVNAALAAGVRVGLGADWMPSGSPSLLHELKIAERVLARQGADVSAADLVEMATTEAAEIAGLGHLIGTLEVGRTADLVILQRLHDDPYDNVVAAYPSWVDLVMIGGDIVYGRPDWVGQITEQTDYERVEAWGRDMLLDTRFGSPDDAPTNGPPRRLSEMRQQLISRYPAVGPIFV